MPAMRFPQVFTVAVLAFASTAGVSRAQPQDQQQVLRLASQIRKKIVTLNNYGVFDYVSFGIGPGTAGYQVRLKGYASRPVLKSACERVVRELELVETVDNQIEVLPNSRMDDDLRAAVYVKIYYHPTLSRYNPNRGAPVYGSRRSVERVLEFGISNDPPMGYHPISIIVKNGHVTLEGAVDSDSDRTIAGLQANQTSGVFSVTNNLEAPDPGKRKKR